MTSANPPKIKSLHFYFMLLCALFSINAYAQSNDYTIHATLRLIPPINKEALNDDFQETKIVQETTGFYEIDVTLHPNRSIPIEANLNWRKDDADMVEYLKPGPSTDWDEKFKEDLVAELKKAKIDPEHLTDKQLVEKTSTWALHYSKHVAMFDTYYVHFPGGRPEIYPGLKNAFQQSKGDPRWSDVEQFQHEVLGRSMFYNRTYGTCTSYAVYQATILRALGIPTRIVLAVPIIDPNDPEQIGMLAAGIHDPTILQTVESWIKAAGSGFTAHTFNEVYIGKRWVRLNYNVLGQSVSDRTYLGLMMHVNTFNDLADANLARTWGMRYGTGARDFVFKTSNPYTTLKISDQIRSK